MLCIPCKRGLQHLILKPQQKPSCHMQQWVPQDWYQSFHQQGLLQFSTQQNKPTLGLHPSTLSPQATPPPFHSGKTPNLRHHQQLINNIAPPNDEISKKDSPFHLEGGVDWSTDSRSSFLVHTKMGPSKSSGTNSPRRTRRSSPVPISCKALPTLPPPTMTAGATLAGGTVTVVGEAMAESLNLNAVMVGGEMEKESEVAMQKWLLSGGGWSEEHGHGSFCCVCLWSHVPCLSIFVQWFPVTSYATRSFVILGRFYLSMLQSFSLPTTLVVSTDCDLDVE